MSIHGDQSIHQGALETWLHIALQTSKIQGGDLLCKKICAVVREQIQRPSENPVKTILQRLTSEGNLRYLDEGKKHILEEKLVSLFSKTKQSHKRSRPDSPQETQRPEKLSRTGRGPEDTSVPMETEFETIEQQKPKTITAEETKTKAQPSDAPMAKIEKAPSQIKREIAVESQYTKLQDSSPLHDLLMEFKQMSVTDREEIIKIIEENLEKFSIDAPVLQQLSTKIAPDLLKKLQGINRKSADILIAIACFSIALRNSLLPQGFTEQLQLGSLEKKVEIRDRIQNQKEILGRTIQLILYFSPSKEKATSLYHETISFLLQDMQNRKQVKMFLVANSHILQILHEQMSLPPVEEYLEKNFAFS